MQERELALKDQEIALERKRAEFAEQQIKTVKEIAEYQRKEYQELLRVKKPSVVEKILTGLVGLILGIFIMK